MQTSHLQLLVISNLPQIEVMNVLYSENKYYEDNYY